MEGRLLPGVTDRLDKLRRILEPWLVSADTQGTLTGLASQLDIQAKRLAPGEEGKQKAQFVAGLGSEGVVAVVNGANDVEILHLARLGIAVVGHEGPAAKCLGVADILVPGIEAGLDLLIYPRRLLATLLNLA